MSTNISNSVLFNMLQGSDITGESAYDVYKAINPDATREDFIEYLKGKSAYEVWLELEGNAGKTEEEFINSISIGDKDWNVNDETSKEYIKNRPFYTDDAVTKIFMEETNLTLDNNGRYILQNRLDLAKDTEYTIIFNSVEYKCTSIEYTEDGMSAILLGDYSLATGKESTGEPFVIMEYSESTSVTIGVIGAIVVFDGSTSPTISISGPFINVHKLDEKYLPKNVVVSTQLGDQVTFTLDGKTLTITPK